MSTAALPIEPVAVPAMPKSASAKPRNGAIDAFRMAAVIPIVFYHAELLAQLPALTGMHALIAAAVFFAAASRSRGTAGEILAKRASRLLPPWIAFGSMHLAMSLKNHTTQYWMYIVGGSMHLWFVPFIYIVTCAMALACRTGEWTKSWGGTIFWSVAALALMHLEARLTPKIEDWVPLWQFLNGGTAVLVALAVLSLPAGKWGQLVLAGVLTLLSLFVWMPWVNGDMMPMSPAALGTLLFTFIRLLPAFETPLTNFLGRASFGLYLMHPVVLRFLELGTAKVKHIPPADITEAEMTLCCIATIGICMVLIAVLERTPLRRLVV